jgi:metal-sulfur cluster biosynthetic enzyme/ribosomal protein L22
MAPTLAAEWHIEEPQLRVTETDGRAALRAVTGQPVIAARTRLRFGPGRTCEQLARLLDRAIVQAEAAGLRPDLLVVADGSVRPAQDIIRVRRKAHGVADWIHTPTCDVQITLHPSGLHATRTPPVPAAATSPAPPVSAAAATPPVPATAPPVPADEASAPVRTDEASAPVRTVRDALSEVIDPDLGVNVVDLGFVRAVTVHERTAVITMTLTSAACPLTGVLENQIRTELAPLDVIDGFHVDWQWIPAWRPADITDSGREQLRAIGFTI